MIFKQLFDSESSTYTYLLGDKTSKESILIDPVRERTQEYVRLINQLGLNLKYVLDTHVHADHVTATGSLRELTGAQAPIYEGARVACASFYFKDGEILPFGSYQAQVIHTPGHTPHAVSYLVEDRLFTGDALLIGGCGRTDFQGGSSSDLWDSVVGKLFKLPDETLVYPGHDYNKMRVSCIGQEKALNPRFSSKTKEEFIQLMANLNLPAPKKIKEAVPANEKCGHAETV